MGKLKALKIGFLAGGTYLVLCFLSIGLLREFSPMVIAYLGYPWFWLLERLEIQEKLVPDSVSDLYWVSLFGSVGYFLGGIFVASLWLFFQKVGQRRGGNREEP